MNGLNIINLIRLKFNQIYCQGYYHNNKANLVKLEQVLSIKLRLNLLIKITLKCKLMIEKTKHLRSCNR